MYHAKAEVVSANVFELYQDITPSPNCYAGFLWGIPAATRLALVAAGDGWGTADCQIVSTAFGASPILAVQLWNDGGTLKWYWYSDYLAGQFGFITTDHTEADEWHLIQLRTLAGVGIGCRIDGDDYGTLLADVATPNGERIQWSRGAAVDGDYYLGQAWAGTSGHSGQELFTDRFAAGTFAGWGTALPVAPTTLTVVEDEFQPPGPVSAYTDDFEGGLGDWTQQGTPAESGDGWASPIKSVLIDTIAANEAALVHTVTMPGTVPPGVADVTQFGFAFALYIEDWGPLWDGGAAWGPYICSWDAVPPFSSTRSLWIQPTSATTGVIQWNNGGGTGGDSVAVPAGEWVSVEVLVFYNGTYANGAGGLYYVQVWVNGVDNGVWVQGGSASKPTGIALGDDGGLGVMPAGCVYYIDQFEFSLGRNGQIDLLLACFGPGCGAGDVFTFAASAIARTSAQLNGQGNPGGVASVGYFEYGDTLEMDQQTAPQALGAGTSFVPFDDVVGGLTASRTYYFRAKMDPA